MGERKIMNFIIKRKLFKTLKDISLEILHEENSTDGYVDANDIFILAEIIVNIEDLRPTLEETLEKLRKEKRIHNENQER